MVDLRSGHIIISANLANKLFNGITFAFATYEKKTKQLLVTPVSSVWFAKVHGGAQFMLKERNREGDKSLAVREIFIEHELDVEDRKLNFELVAKTKLLKICLQK
ncbi:MAG: hypothetical protein AAF634_15200 [Bacteroidota bacterium]